MFAPRVSRNIESSLIDFVAEQLSIDGWQDVRVEKKSANVYSGELPAILINVINIIPVRKEIGSYLTRKKYLVSLRIFANDDGQRLDLSDWLQDEIEPGIDYYAYTYKLEGRKKIVDTKILSGRLYITRFLENKQELETVQNLAVEDKHRHLITVEMELSLLPTGY